MAHIVCITSGLTGILHASFELVAQLEAAGHRVTYASPKAVQENVELQGFQYVQLAPTNFFPAPEIPPFNGIFRKIHRWFFKVKNVRQRRVSAVVTLGMDDFGKILLQLSPDLLIIDVECHEHLMKAYTMNIPMILLSQWFSIWKRPGLPPLVEDTIPGQGWRGHSLVLEATWQLLKIQRWKMFLKKKLTSVFTDRRSILQYYAQQIGFPLKYANENYFPGPFTYNTLPVINMTALEMEFPHSIRPASFYIGPMVYSNRKNLKKDEAIEKQLLKIFEEKKKTKATLIYCSVSTYKEGDQNFLKKITQAVENKKNWILILGLGGMLGTDFLQPIPNNVYAFSWVPQLLVLQWADCSINHGGIHTINECIHYRVPMLVYSGKRSDQNGCAARVAFHGLGIMADKDTDGVEEIRSKITEVLKEDSYKKQIEKMYQHYQDYKKEKRLEKVIEKVIKEHQLKVENSTLSLQKKRESKHEILNDLIIDNQVMKELPEGKNKNSLNLSKKIDTIVILRYIAELTSIEENVFIEKCIRNNPKLQSHLKVIQDILEDKVGKLAKRPKQDNKQRILKTIKNEKISQDEIF